MPSFERHGGRLLATSMQDTKVLEGSWASSRTVLLEFPFVRNAEDWYSDPEYVELMKIRHRTAKTNLVLVEGLDDQKGIWFSEYSRKPQVHLHQFPDLTRAFLHNSSEASTPLLDFRFMMS